MASCPSRVACAPCPPQGVRCRPRRGSSSNGCAARWPPCRHRPDGLGPAPLPQRSEEHTSELQSRLHLVCRLLLEKKNNSLVITTSLAECDRTLRGIDHALRLPRLNTQPLITPTARSRSQPHLLYLQLTQSSVLDP